MLVIFIKVAESNSVIQRQLWLIRNHPELTRAQVYDQARKEFYELRLQEEVRRQVAKEEAMATGAYFGKSLIDIGMDLEDQEYGRWREWAERQIVLAEQRAAAGNLRVSADGAESEEEPEPEVGLEENEGEEETAKNVE